MRDPESFAEHIRDLAVAPPPRAEHREALRAELKRRRRRRRLTPVLVAAAAVVVFGAVLMNEDVLESTGYRFHFAETIGDTVLVLAPHEGAREGIGYGEGHDNQAITLTDARLAEVQSRMVQAKMDYETGVTPLYKVLGTVFNGQESYELQYRSYFGDEFLDYPVPTDKTILDLRFYEYCRTDAYKEFAADVALNRVAQTSSDTMYFNDIPVLMRRWQRSDPIYGEIELSEGYPLR